LSSYFRKKNQPVNNVEINPRRVLLLCFWTDEQTDGQTEKACGLNS